MPKQGQPVARVVCRVCCNKWMGEGEDAQEPRQLPSSMPVGPGRPTPGCPSPAAPWLPPTPLPCSFHPDKTARMVGVIDYYIKGNEHGLDKFPGGSEVIVLAWLVKANLAE